MYQKIGRNLNYPLTARRMGVEGTVFIQFILTEEGAVTECAVLRSIDPDMDQESLKAVCNLKNWTPGKFQGKPVKYRVVVPVSFKLADSIKRH